MLIKDYRIHLKIKFKKYKNSWALGIIFLIKTNRPMNK